MPSPDLADVPVFILCGGQGTRLSDGTTTLPKPMIEIGEHPMLLHVMRCYDRCGFRRFVLCTGYQSEVIAAYFHGFAIRNADFTIELRSREIVLHQRDRLPDWTVTVAFTGHRTMTGGRLARATTRFLGDAQHFAVTYADGLTDADLAAEYDFHLAHDRLGTVLAVHPPSRFGRLELNEEAAASFVEKPKEQKAWINGGFFFFRRAFTDYLEDDERLVLEERPLRRLVAEQELAVFRHAQFWSCVDTVKERDEMRSLWEAGTAPWR